MTAANSKCLFDYKNYRKEKILRYADSIINHLRVFPPSLHVALTDKCFNRCIMCGHWKRKIKTEICLDDLINFLSFGKRNFLETVCYSGGDPLAYSDLNSLMDWHIVNDLDFSFVTSGYITDNIDLTMLSKSKWIRVSLDSISNYQECRGGIDVGLVLSSLEKMLENKMHVELGITLHLYNTENEQLIEILDFACEKLLPTRCWLVRHEEQLLPRNPMLDSILFIFSEKMNGLGIPNNLNLTREIFRYGENRQSFEKCYAPLFQLFINPDGRIFPCCILAGDSEERPHSKALGNITDSWDVVVSNVLDFDKNNYANICDEKCITRLITINETMTPIINKREFI